MTKHRIQDSKHEVAVAPKEPVGKLIGPAGTVVAGHLENGAGKFPKKPGKAPHGEKKHHR